MRSRQAERARTGGQPAGGLHRVRPDHEGQWYDLCNDGTVRSPSASGPCTGTQISTSPYRGWYWTPRQRDDTRELAAAEHGYSYPGVYYVYGANAVLGANGNSHSGADGVGDRRGDDPAGYTNAATCNKYGGNITWKKYDIQNYLRGVLFIAQGSLSGSANSSAQAGLMLAGDKVDLQTSSGSVQGSLIANNTCAAAGPNTVQGMEITYDESVEAPVYSVVNTTLWLEYTG